MVPQSEMTNRGIKISSSMSKSDQTDASKRYPIVPNESFLEILSYIQIPVKPDPTERAQILSELSQLSLACRFFCTTLRPRLFRRLVLDGHSDSPSVAFCRAIMRGDVHARALAVHVHYCKISYWSYGYCTPGAAASPTTTHHWALHWAPNIECLKLSDSSNIDSGFWGVIGGLSKLRTLKLASVSFQDDIPDEEIDHIARLRVSNLKLSNSQVFSLPQVLNLTLLAKLECDPDSIDILRAAIGPIDTLEALAITYWDIEFNISVSELSVSTEINTSSLKTILSKAPSLRDLIVHCETFEEDPEVTPQDFFALLPNLHSLACSCPLLAYLAPSGPLVSLTVAPGDSETPPLNLGAILESYGLNTITELAIPSTIYLANGQCLPHLNSIDVRLPGIGQFDTPDPGATAELMTLVADFCDKWAVSLTIQQLHMSLYTRFPLMDLALQHAMLYGALSQKFPALLSFQLTREVLWERSAVGEAWRVSVPTRYQADVVARFKAGDPCVVDYDGYLQRLSAQHDLFD